MPRPSFIRTVTAGTGFLPVHVQMALVGFPRFSGVTTGRE